MCSFDHAERATILSEGYRKAKKEHKCEECWRVIKPGERYYSTAMISDGFNTHKTCLGCHHATELISDKCHGWVYGEIKDEMRSHAYPGVPWSMLAARFYVAMRRKWRSFTDDGLLTSPWVPAKETP